MSKIKSEYTRQVDKTIGNRVKKLRTHLKLSRKYLACKIGVSMQQVAKYEDGIDSISSGKLMLISKTLQRPVSYFFLEVE